MFNWCTAQPFLRHFLKVEVPLRNFYIYRDSQNRLVYDRGGKQAEGPELAHAPKGKLYVIPKGCSDNLKKLGRSASMWPSSSAFSASLDYGMWGVFEFKVLAKPHKNVDDLMASMEKEWAAMSEDYLIKVCKVFRPRVEAMVKAEDAHFEV